MNSTTARPVRTGTELLAAIAIGALAGYAIGVLTARAAGRYTRRRVRHRLEHASANATLALRRSASVNPPPGETD